MVSAVLALQDERQADAGFPTRQKYLTDHPSVTQTGHSLLGIRFQPVSVLRCFVTYFVFPGALLHLKGVVALVSGGTEQDRLVKVKEGHRLPSPQQPSARCCCTVLDTSEAIQAGLAPPRAISANHARMWWQQQGHRLQVCSLIVCPSPMACI